MSVTPSGAPAADPQSFDGLAEGYDFLSSLEGWPDFFLASLPARRRRALDVGCGTGRLSAALAGHFDEVLGIDVSGPMLEVARRRRPAPNLRYLCADAERYAPEGGFDLVASRTTFHHLRDPAGTARRLAACLAPGGRLVIVDNVHPVPQVSWLVVIGSPLLDVVPDAVRIGPARALRKARLRLSPPWVRHLRSDRYLSRAGFRALYGAALPGARFERFGVFMAVLHDAPDRRGAAT